MRDLLHTCAVKLCVIWKNWPKMCGNHKKLSGNPGIFLGASEQKLAIYLEFKDFYKYSPSWRELKVNECNDLY